MSFRKYIVITIVLMFSPVLMASSFFSANRLHSISPGALHDLMQKKDIFLVDVHIPEARHIRGTDLFVPFNRIRQHASSFPEDRSVPIYLYCVAGHMGNIAAETLAKLGYKKIYNLEGGTIAWENAGYGY